MSMSSSITEVVEINGNISQQRTSTPIEKPRRKRSRVATGDMVLDAIKHVGSKEKGASVQKIKRYIYSTYDVDPKKIDIFIIRYINKALRTGKLLSSSGLTGAVGFFKISATALKSNSSEKRSPSSIVKKRIPGDRPQRKRKAFYSDNRPLLQLWRNSAVTAVMDDITDVYVEPLTNSQYVKPFRMHYRQNNIQKIWDLVTLHDSVSIIIFNTEKKKLILVRQFRPAVYYSGVSPGDRALNNVVNTHKYPGITGLTLELCAGILEKNKSPEETAKEEVLEECGYDIPVSSLEKVMTFRSGVGVAGERQTMYYVEVTNKMKVSEGGGVVAEGEMIEVVEMSLEELRVFLRQSEVNCPSGLLFGLNWFLLNKAPKK